VVKVVFGCLYHPIVHSEFTPWRYNCHDEGPKRTDFGCFQRGDAGAICGAFVSGGASGGRHSRRDTQNAIEKEAPRFQPVAGQPLHFWVVPQPLKYTDTAGSSGIWATSPGNQAASAKFQRQ
jgi:hypothetical protein